MIGDNLIESKLQKILGLLGLATGIIIVYFIAVIASSNILILLGIDGDSLFHFILSIVLTSIIVFIGTLIIHFIFQKVPFLNESKFHAYFSGVHLIFIYISGLIAVLSILKPVLLEYSFVDKGIDSNVVGIFVMIFFIIITNYNFYTEIVIANKFSFFQSNSQGAIISIPSLYNFIAISTMAIMFARFFFIKELDGVFLITSIILNTPILIRIFLERKKLLKN